MKWLRGILGTKPNYVQPSGLDPQLQALVDEHLLPAFDRQLAFGEIVGDRAWQLDQDAGVLRLGDDMVLPAQVLGTVSEASGSWRWAWANDSVAEILTRRAREATAIGRERGIGVLTDADVDLGRIFDGHVLALVVAGMLGADAYYRCPYDGGEVFVLVELPPMGRDSAESVSSRAMSVVSQALLGVPVPIRQIAGTNYLRGLGLPVRETDGDVRVEDGSKARFRFDRQGRLTEIRGTRSDENLDAAGPVAAPPAPQGVPLDQWADNAKEAAEDSPSGHLSPRAGGRATLERIASRHCRDRRRGHDRDRNRHTRQLGDDERVRESCSTESEHETRLAALHTRGGPT